MMKSRLRTKYRKVSVGSVGSSSKLTIRRTLNGISLIAGSSSSKAEELPSAEFPLPGSTFSSPTSAVACFSPSFDSRLIKLSIWAQVGSDLCPSRLLLDHYSVSGATVSRIWKPLLVAESVVAWKGSEGKSSIMYGTLSFQSFAVSRPISELTINACRAMGELSL
jgi:hypothetical protein